MKRTPILALGAVVASALGLAVGAALPAAADPTGSAVLAMVAKPMVNGVSVASGPEAGGTVVTIVGSNLSAVTAVRFGSSFGTDLRLTSPSTLTVIAPAHRAGTVDVRVTTANGSSPVRSADRFTYLDTTPPDSVNAVSARGTTSTVILRWANPSTDDFTGVTIRRATGPIAPTTADDGDLVTVTTGDVSTFTDRGRRAGTQYSYALFARDAVPNYAAAVTTTVTIVTAGSCTVSWTGGAGNSAWDRPRNWSTGHTPRAQDWVCLPAATPGLPVQLRGSERVAGLTNDGGLVISGTLTLTSSASMNVSTGPLTVTGSLSTVGGLNLQGLTSFPSGTARLQGYFFNSADATTTVGVNATIYLVGASTFSNSGALSFAPDADIDGDCAPQSPGGHGTPRGSQFINDGTIVSAGTQTHPVIIGTSGCLQTENWQRLDAGSGKTILGGDFSLVGDGSIAGDATALIVVQNTVSADGQPDFLGDVEVDGRLVTGGIAAFNSVSLSSGTIELTAQAHVTIEHAAISGGTLQLDGDNPDTLGQLTVAGTSSAPSHLVVNLSGPSLDPADYTPSCGARVPAFVADELTTSFIDVTGSPLPEGGAWVADLTATVASGVVECGPPDNGGSTGPTGPTGPATTQFSFTFDSPQDPWDPADLAILEQWTAPDSPELAAVYAVAGRPQRDTTLNIERLDAGAFAGDYYYGAHTVRLKNVDLDVFVHELNHAVHDQWVIANQVWEEGLARAGEDEELRLLALQGITSTLYIDGVPSGTTGDPFHAYTYDVYYDELNVPSVAPQGGSIYGDGYGNLALLRYEMGGYAFGKVLIEHPDFLKQFNATLFTFDPTTARTTSELVATAASVVDQVEGQPFAQWYAAQRILDGSPPSGCQIFQRVNQFTLDFFCRVDGYATRQLDGDVTLTVYKADGALLWSGHDTAANSYGLFPDLAGYVGRITVVATGTSPNGSATSTVVRPSGPEDGVFGVIANADTGTVTLTSTTGSFAPVTVAVKDGRLVAPTLGAVRGTIQATFTGTDGSTASKVFTKAESPYALTLTVS